ncbi:MAG: type II toxin-antitoxin system PemK/MazF family toxin [Phormidesmis sp. CAN_BIN44]|nr:type II toxin-antitoxin system PemK/MazF family toxin [Phormidesmis sp. CAN_BIN44]
MLTPLESLLTASTQTYTCKPTRGQEIQKTRPVVVITADLFNPIPLRIIVPITSWQAKFSDRPFMVSINVSSENGLDRDSAGNVLQVRSLSTERFMRRLGQVSDEILQELLAGLVICVDYEQNQ